MLSSTLPLVLSVVAAWPAAMHRDSCDAPAGGRRVAAAFVGDRVFVRWHVHGHGDLLLYTDTGGGLLALYPEAVRRLGLAVDTTSWVRGPYHGSTLTARIPRALEDAGFPSIPTADSAGVEFLVQNTEPAPDEEAGYAWDGRIGSMWFADRVWTLDYPRRRLYFGGTAPTGPSAPGCWTPLGLQVDSAGHRTTSFPRIAATIDGETLQFLLDTGARTTLTDGAWRALGTDEPRHRAASFITRTRFDAWHARHPDWLVVPDAEQGDSLPMIRVPAVEVAGRVIGPVWFTERPDRNFREFMSAYMDQPIEGALGGSAWRSVTLVLDYPRARAAVLAGATRRPPHRRPGGN